MLTEVSTRKLLGKKMRISPEYLLGKVKESILNRNSIESTRKFPIDFKEYELHERKSSFDENKSEYNLRELLSYFDVEFINNIYRGVLKRDPDVTGFDSRLKSLREREYSRVNLLGRIRFSEEGKKAGVKIKGLIIALIAEKIYSLPVFGHLLAILRVLWSLPTLHSHIEAIQGDVFALRNELDGLTGKMTKHYDEQLRVIVDSMSEHLYDLSDLKKRNKE